MRMYAEVAKSQFSSVKPLLGAQTYLSLYAIIEHKSSGRIWVNDESSVKSAFVWDLVNGFLFALGKSNSEIDFPEANRLLKEELVPEACKKGYTKLNAILLLDLTEAQNRMLFDGLSTSIEDLCHFRLEGTEELKTPNLAVPRGFGLKRIDQRVLNNSRLANIGEIRRCIMACWQDLDRYLSDGVGFVIFNDVAAVSWCSTDYVVSGKCDLYVETFEAYRRKGFGTIVASACIKECLSRKLEVNWHCWSQNLESTGLVLLIEQREDENGRLAKGIGSVKRRQNSEEVGVGFWRQIIGCCHCRGRFH
jgi:GNAT superfamily N-acetyltransferase